MAIIKKQYYGIKFPFTANNLNGFFLDLNSGIEEKVASEIAHVLLTPKGSRIRKPDFGTDIIKYLFENNEQLTWEAVENEARENVKRYVPGVELTSIETVTPPEDPHAVFLDMTFTVKKGNTVENNRMAIKL